MLAILTTVSIIFSIVIARIDGYFIPLNPCYRYYQYNFDGSEWYVELIVPRPIDSIDSIKISVMLSLPVRLTTIYNAKLTFVATSPNAVGYRLSVSQLLPMPQPIEIIVNGHTVCVGPTAASPVKTLVRINHVKILKTTPTFEKETLNHVPDVSTPRPKRSEIDNQPLNEVCGKSLSGSQHLNGNAKLQRGDFPWVAAMYDKKTDKNQHQYRCAATLISSKYALTAGHCVKSGNKPLMNASKVIVYLGMHRISENEKDSLKVEVITIHLHPDYKQLGSMSDSDLAILEFKTPIKFNQWIRPVCLWSKESNDLYDVVGSVGIVVSWSLDMQGNFVQPEPRKIQMPIVSQEECLWSHKDFVYVASNRTFCAGSRDGRTGPCTGDSGGGLVIFRNNRWLLRGIVSLALKSATTFECDLSNYAVFVDVAKHTKWLEQFLT